MFHHRQPNQRHRPRKKQQNAKALRAYLSMMCAGLLLGLIIAGGLLMWQRLNDPQTLPFHEIRINGQFQHINPKELRQILQPQIQSGFFSLKLAPLQQSLLTNPWVEDASIRRIPGVLVVTVREHQAVARWNDQYLVNSDDQLFQTPPDAPKGLPQLRGPEESRDLVLNHYKQINSLFKPLDLQIQQITLDDRQSWEVVFNSGMIVTIGRDDVIPRMQRLAKWYPQITQNSAESITHIDLRYPNSIAVGFSNDTHSTLDHYPI